MCYQVTIHPGPHSGAFREVAETLLYALRSLGHAAIIDSDTSTDAQHIILGDLRGLEPCDLRPGSIIYNLEQVGFSSPFMTPGVLCMLKAFPVWDYSARNADELEWAGVSRPTVVPIGYVPQLTRIQHEPDKDIDVLFYGSINERRDAVLKDIESRGYRVARLYGVYGAARDAVIARSRLVINIHYYPAKVFEIVRVSYLLANGVPVVSELPTESDMTSAVAFARYGELADRCDELLQDPKARQRMAGAGLRIMRSRPESDYLRAALDSAPSPC